MTLRLPEDLQIEEWTFHIPKVSDESRAAADRLINNLKDLRRHYLEYAHGVALDQYGSAVEKQAREDWHTGFKADLEEMKRAVDERRMNDVSGMSRPIFPPPSVWPTWSTLGRNGAVFALRNYGHTVGPVRNGHRAVPEWQGKVDSDTLKRIRKAFDERFPDSTPARNAVAHPEDYNRAGREHGVTGNVVSRDGQLVMRDVGNFVLRDSLIGNHYTTTFEGRLIEIEFSADAARFLRDLTLQAEQAYAEVLTSFHRRRSPF